MSLPPIVFPLKGDGRANGRAKAPAEKIGILIVDDHPANLLSLESMLDHPEFDLVRAPSGPDALRELLRRDFALVLLDVLMPGMDGFATAALIRKRKQSASTPIIFLTAAHPNDAQVAQGYSLGAVDYIYKPIKPEILKAKVQVFVELFKKTRQLASSEEALKRELAEHKRAEEERRENEGLYQELFRRASDAIVVFDARGRKVLDANQAALGLFGYPRSEFVGLTREGLMVEREAELPMNQAVVRLRRTKDGRTFPAEISQGTVVLKGRRLFMSFTRDITERRKAAEAELLREREAMQRQFIATISHELRTPIAAVKAAAESLRRGAGADAKVRGEFIKIIENQSNRLDGFVEELLILAELESGKVQPKSARVPLREMLDECLEDIAPLVARRMISVRINVPHDLEVWVDRAHLARVLQNLLDNAIKYNRKGGSIRVEARAGGDLQAEITVSDTGIGISQSELPLIFQQFQRTQTAREMAIGGTGLGLFIIKNMVEANGGRIWAESVKGEGSAFHFTLPLAEAEARRKGAKIGAQEGSRAQTLRHRDQRSPARAYRPE